jgi:uncharacterized protein YodC (DUF2158 family)
MDYRFEVGDTVRMKIGSPELTVIRILGKEKEDQFAFIDRFGYEEGDVICEWSDGNNYKCDIFRRTALELLRKQELSLLPKLND